MKAKWIAVAVLAVAVSGWMTMVAFAADTQAGQEGRHRLMTEEQRAAVKSIISAARPEIQDLRESLKTEVGKLRDLRQDKAGEEAIKAQIAVVKNDVAALKSRVEELRADLKAAMPPEAYAKLQQWRHQRIQQFLDNHPALKERWTKRQGQATE